MAVAAASIPVRSLIDSTRIVMTAEVLRRKSGQFQLPISVKGLIEATHPDVMVTGQELPRGVFEVAHVDDQGNRTIFYNRRINPLAQRVAIVHGLAHLLFDAWPARLECVRSYDAPRSAPSAAAAIERRADLLAAELLTPMAELDRRFEGDLFPRGEADRRCFDDHVDNVASSLKVPPGFLRWRLYDLAQIRKTSWMVG